jgi:2-oxoglutarate dehydrogenase E2 component (dihydrolipoamide succinyltransferase)
MSILEMKVPSPGESITEVEIATWLVKDGDYVEKDQAIAEVDSDKATLELPAEESGIITKSRRRRGCKSWSSSMLNR